MGDVRTVSYPADALKRVGDRLQDDFPHLDNDEVATLAFDLTIEVVEGVDRLRAREAYEAPKARMTVLWARSDRYKRPCLVAAWSDGYVDAYSVSYHQERDEKLRWFRDFGDPSDGPWTFWTTQEDLVVDCDHAFQRHPEAEDVGICTHCGAEEIDA